MLKWLEKYWPMVAVIGFLITFASRLEAVWRAPEALEETQNQIQELSGSVQSYIDQSAKTQNQLNNLIALLVDRSLKDKEPT